MALSEQSWEAAELDARESGRDVIRLHVITAAASEREAGIVNVDPVILSIQSVLHTLDDRWAVEGKKPAIVVRDTQLRLAARSEASLLLVSDVPADLFGMTPAAPAIRQLFGLLRVTGDSDRIIEQLQRQPARVVLAYGQFLESLHTLEAAQVRIEWLSPGEEQAEAEISAASIQACSSYIHAAEESVATFQVTGKLSMMNPEKRMFSLTTEDGTVYSGKWSAAFRQWYAKEAPVFKLPLPAEAVLERRTINQPSIGQQQVRDTLLELDTDLGLDAEETLYAFKELYASLDASLDQDSQYITGKGVSLEDYTLLSDLLDGLLDSNPAKGARSMMNAADAAAVYELLAVGKPIGRLAKLGAERLHGAGGYSDDERAGGGRAMGRTGAGGDLAKLAAAAYVDMVQLLKRLAGIIAEMEKAMAAAG